MVCTYQINFREHCSSAQGCGEVVNVRNWVTVWRRLVVELAIVPTRSPVSTTLLGTICKGEAQGLEEGLMIPSCNMCSNSRRATLRRSGASLRARAETGGPFVAI